MGYRFGNVDTIYRPSSPKPVEKTPGLSSVAKKTPRQGFYFFYKALQVVLSFWIVTVMVIVTQPWLDYWVKSTIKKNTSGQVLSQNTALPQEIVGTGKISQTPQFHLHNTRVDIKAPIVEGIDTEALKKGIGHHPDSVWPNKKGNIVLAGHNFDLDAENPYGQIFISLRLVDVGDLVTLEWQGQKYTYQVFKKETVSAKDTSLFGHSDEWLLTFYTCDPPYTDWKRLVLQAKLVKIE